MAGYLKLSAFKRITQLLADFALVGHDANGANIQIAFKDFYSQLSIASTVGGGTPVFFTGTVLPSVDNTGQPVARGAWTLLAAGVTYTNIGGGANITPPNGRWTIGVFNGTSWEAKDLGSLPTVNILDEKGESKEAGISQDFATKTRNLLEASIKVNPNVVPNWANGLYINTTGSQASNASFHSTQALPIPSGLKKIKLTGDIRYGAVQNNISFYDVAGAFISGVQIQSTTEEQSIDIPNGAYTYRLSNALAGGIITSFFNVADVAQSVVSKFFEIEISVNRWVDGFYLNSAGQTLANSSWSVSEFIYIPEDSFLLTARILAATNISAVAWYSHADASSFISSTVINSNTTYSRESFNRPTNGRFVRISVTTALKSNVFLFVKSIYRLLANQEINNVIDYINYNPTAPTVGMYINNLGRLSNASGWNSSDYQPCIAGVDILFSGSSTLTGSTQVNRISFYSDKTEASFISGLPMLNTGANTWTDEVVTPPVGAQYYRLSANNSVNYAAYRIRLKLSTTLSIIEKEVHKIRVQATESKIAVPQFLDSVIGRNNDFFLDFSNINPDVEPGNFIVLGNDSAAQIVRRGKAIRHVPVAASTNNNLTYTLRDNAFNIIEQKTMTLRPVSKNVGTGTEQKNIVLAGDSLVDNTSYPAEVYALLAEDGDFVINQIGTRGTTAKHEGRGSWSWASYLNPAYETTAWPTGTGRVNAFMKNGVLNFQAYINDNFPALTRKEIDVFSMNLGTNDVGQGLVARTDAEIEVIINNAKTFIDAFTSASTGFPNAKFIIGLCSKGAPELPTSDRSGAIFARSISKLNQRYIDVFDNGKYHANVTVVMHGAYIDRVNSYQFVDEPVNDYVTQTVRVYTDGIHPQNIGYRQLGRGVYGKIRAVLAGRL